MSISQLSPKEIKEILIKRLTSTNEVWKKRDTDSPEQEKVIFFKYYFDFSSAIESCLRNIVFVYAKNADFGGCIKVFAEPESSKKAYFLNCEEFCAIVNIDKISEKFLKKDFITFCNDLIPDMKISNLPCNFSYCQQIKEKYNKIRSVRNTIAHGLKAFEVTTIEYSQSQLLEFIHIFYLLFDYYNKINKNQI